MSGWTIATIVLGCLLLFSIVAIIDTGIDAKWKAESYISIFLFIFLFPIALPFAIWNWIYEANKKSEDVTLLSEDYKKGYDKGYKEGHSVGYRMGYEVACDLENNEEDE